MKQTFRIMMLMAALTLAWGCSSDDDDQPQEPEVVEPTPEPTPEPTAVFTATEGQPEWLIDWTWHDETPDWENPDPANFEVRMYVVIKLDDKYAPYSTDDDRFAIFIKNKCRGVGMRNVTHDGRIFFPIIILGNNEDVGANTEIRYYCAAIKHTFNYPGYFYFTPDRTIGNESDFEIKFGEGSPKYMNNYLPASKFTGMPFEASGDDMIAAFVGDECRGIAPANSGLNVFTLVGREEEVSFRYYSANKGGYYTFPQTLKMGVGHRSYSVMTFEF